MTNEEKRELVATLFEELVLAQGIIKEICQERGILPPSASLDRMDKALAKARRELPDF
ncbi:hypothetical protein [Erwinia sp. QL-Z3]|uniref:hypothetical protein n=1 Tax=Erwinia sp. QL-Z3 TaxID=2547962 RepID=UPI00143101B3|nr:hypothetical protein [Erwinia sp. QL-Z3]